ncbi:MAG: RNase adapter RapZ [Actinomycetes bacterium]
MAEFVIVTGMSGAGRSTAAASLEDLGWFVIDNLPSSIIPRVGELVHGPGTDTPRVALIVGRKGSGEAADLLDAVDRLTQGAHVVRVLFLDAADDVLIRRYEGTRRRHPRTGSGVEDAVAEERIALEVIRQRADIVLDTGELNSNQLRSRIFELFGEQVGHETMRTSLMSFGFKHGIPLDVDMVFDARFLPNPHWIEDLRPMSGLDEPVRAFVLEQPEAGDFVDRIVDLVSFLLPAYVREGKSYLTIGIGCTGGRHRSVAISEEMAHRLRASGHPIATFHRDIDR